MRLGQRFARTTRVLATGAIVAGGVIIASAPAAHAVLITPVCDAFGTDANGDPTQPALSTGNPLPGLNIPALGNGATVKPGTTFTVNTPGTAATLPKQVTTTVGGQSITVTVNEVKNIALGFKITGAASVGKPTLSGGSVLKPTAASTNTSFTLTLPGSKNGSTAPKGSAFFAGGGTFTTPAISMSVTAQNKPGSITTSLATLNMLASVSLAPGTPALVVALECTAPPNTVGSVAVAVPGAPVAVNDEASTKPGTPVTIDVLANDKPSANGQAPDPSTLTVASNPAHGTAAVSGGKIVYTPGSSFTNGDSFTYQVCVFVPNPTTTTASTTTTTLQPDARRIAAVTAPKGTTAACAVATVTVATESVQAVTTTTVATLPRTGSSSAPLALIGGGLLTLGLAALGFARHRVAPQS